MAPSVRSALWGEYFSAQLTNLASVIYAFEARSATAEQADSVDQIGYVAMEQAVSTRRPIFASRGADQTIGYLEGGRAYDLSDRLRCDYNEATDASQACLCSLSASALAADIWREQSLFYCNLFGVRFREPASALAEQSFTLSSSCCEHGSINQR